LSVNRDTFVDALRAQGIGCSVHWRPLHLHPYYAETLGWRTADCACATETWVRLISLPIYSGMTPIEVARVVDTVRDVCIRHRR
jgi:perosamine synthetase